MTVAEPQDRRQRAVKPAIAVRGVSKAYKIYDRPTDFLGEVLLGRKAHREKLVLSDIDLEIAPGEVVGIVGRNGAGKSTLLKMIAGTLAPSRGKIAVSGRVSAILELGTGFNPAYSGRDNVIMSALMRGMSEQAIAAKFDSIVAFAGLEDVIDQPFHTYSSGMQARLAFAAAVAVDADVIIIDEALAAGDIRFTARSLRRVREICESGVTALFVSHQTYHVMQLCSRAIWIDDGRIRMDGPPIEVCRAYEYEMHAAIARDEGRANVAVMPMSEAGPDAAEEIATQPAEVLATPTIIEDEAAPAPDIDPAPVEAPPLDSATDTPASDAATADLGADLDEPASEAPPLSPSGPVIEPQARVEDAATEGRENDGSDAQTEPASSTPVAEISPGDTERSASQPLIPQDEKPAHFSSNQYRIVKIEFLNGAGEETRVFRFGEPFRLRVSYECLLPEPPEFSCGLAAAFTSTPEHLAVMYFNTNYPHSDAEMAAYFDADFRQYKGKTGVVEAYIPYLQVKPGAYLVSLGILPNKPEVHEFYEYHHLAFQIAVLPNGFPEPSVFYAQVHWRNGPLSDA